MLGIPAHTIHGHIVVIVNDERREKGDVYQPLLAEYLVVGIAATEAKKSDVDMDV